MSKLDGIFGSEPLDSPMWEQGVRFAAESMRPTVDGLPQLNLPELHPKQLSALETLATEVLYGGAAGGGKALDVDTPVPVPDGWTTMGDLRVGDVVYGGDGRLVRVVAVSDVMESRPCYSVLFNDGEEIVADGEHLWVTFDVREREQLLRRSDEYRERRRMSRVRRGTGKRPDLVSRNENAERSVKAPPTGTVRSTAEIGESVVLRGRLNHTIHGNGRLIADDVDLEIPPYMLGAWLGDGTSSQGAITTADDSIVWHLRDLGYEVRSRPSKRLEYGILRLKKQLVSLGVLNNKHIPAQYLRASSKQRLELLRGLMDTDGTWLPDGSCEYYTTTKALADGVQELLQTFGIRSKIGVGRAMLYGKDCGPKYRLKFVTGLRVFRLARKGVRQRVPTRGRHRWRRIESVTQVQSVPVRCIQVDSSDGIFLVGKSMVPTHNSHLMRHSSIKWCSDIPGLRVYLFRRIHEDLWDNHMLGPSGYEALLSPWIQSGHVKIKMSPSTTINFWNTSQIRFCHFQHEVDRRKYLGAEMHVLMIDELVTFSVAMYKFLRSRVRLTGLKVPEKYVGQFPRVLCGSNPGNIGHAWVKAMFVSPKPPLDIWEVKKSDGGMNRQFIPAVLEDNPSMTENDPKYESRLAGLGDKALVEAMRYGNWDIVAGGMFDDLFTGSYTPKFVCNPFQIPLSWRIDRSYDYGSSAPFVVLWFAESDGTDAPQPDGTVIHAPKGTVFAINEWYGWNGQPNEGCRMLSENQGRGVLERERKMLESGFIQRIPDAGPADSSIFTVEDGKCIATEFSDVGVDWLHANKSPGSRKVGWELIRKMLINAKERPMEKPGLVMFHTCRHLIRTLAELPRDPKDQDDANTNAEDHAPDALRYRLVKDGGKVGSARVF